MVRALGNVTPRTNGTESSSEAGDPCSGHLVHGVLFWAGV
jgi:hypothetical protein